MVVDNQNFHKVFLCSRVSRVFQDCHTFRRRLGERLVNGIMISFKSRKLDFYSILCLVISYDFFLHSSRSFWRVATCKCLNNPYFCDGHSCLLMFLVMDWAHQPMSPELDYLRWFETRFVNPGCRSCFVPFVSICAEHVPVLLPEHPQWIGWSWREADDLRLLDVTASLYHGIPTDFLNQSIDVIHNPFPKPMWKDVSLY